MQQLCNKRKRMRANESPAAVRGNSRCSLSAFDCSRPTNASEFFEKVCCFCYFTHLFFQFTSSRVNKNCCTFEKSKAKEKKEFIEEEESARRDTISKEASSLREKSRSTDSKIFHPIAIGECCQEHSAQATREITSCKRRIRRAPHKARDNQGKRKS